MKIPKDIKRKDVWKDTYNYLRQRNKKKRVFVNLETATKRAEKKYNDSLEVEDASTSAFFTYYES